MRLYASTPRRMAFQIAADLLAVVAIWTAVSVGVSTHDEIDGWKSYGVQIEGTGETLASSLTSMGLTLSQLPWIGEIIGQPFDAAADAAGGLQAAGEGMQAEVAALADRMGWIVAGFPILVVLLAWIPPRARFALHATRAARLARAPHCRDLFAARALASAPLGQLAALGPDIAQRWREGDPQAIAALAALGARAEGVRLPDAQRAENLQDASRAPLE